MKILFKYFKTYSTSYTNLAIASFENILKDTMYIPETWTLQTQKIRSSYWRRIHIFLWLHTFNIIANWAKDYRYFKKIITFLMQSTITLNKKINFNFCKNNEIFLKKIEDFKKTTILLFLDINFSKLFFNKNIFRTFLSSPTIFSDSKITNTNFLNKSILFHSQKNLYSSLSPFQTFSLVAKMNYFVTYKILFFIKEIFKIFKILIFLNLKY